MLEIIADLLNGEEDLGEETWNILYNKFMCGYYAVKYRVLLWTGKWAKYVDRDVESQASFTKKALECLPNRLTPFIFWDLLRRRELSKGKDWAPYISISSL